MTPIDLFWDRSVGPIVFGENDCCVTLADVIIAAGGPDLMAEYRNRYRTRRGFVRAFRRAGHSSLEAAVEVAFSRNGVLIDEPRDFDVGLVSYLDSGLAVASPAFFHSGFWFARTERGGMATAATRVRTYRVI